MFFGEKEVAEIRLNYFGDISLVKAPFGDISKKYQNANYPKYHSLPNILPWIFLNV